jgi:hypothetical protein
VLAQPLRNVHTLLDRAHQFFGGQLFLLRRHWVVQPVMGQPRDEHIVAALKEFLAQAVELWRGIGVTVIEDDSVFGLFPV